MLRLLLKHRDGRSVDELAAALMITRTAVRQHLMALEADGYVARGEDRRTAGRPGQTYRLSPRGAELFPKQYSWFSGVLLQALRDERGSEGLAEWLRGLAGTIAQSLQPRLAGKAPEARLEEVVAIMGELAFEAQAAHAPGDPTRPGVAASNCIYHELAERFPEVCQFDLALLNRLLGAPLEHQECMVRGGQVCRFLLPAAPAEGAAPSTPL